MRNAFECPGIGRSPAAAGAAAPRRFRGAQGHVGVNRCRTFAIKDQTSIEDILGQALTIKLEDSIESRVEYQSSTHIIGPYICGPRGCKLIMEADLKQPSEALFSAEFSGMRRDTRKRWRVRLSKHQKPVFLVAISNSV